MNQTFNTSPNMLQNILNMRQQQSQQTPIQQAAQPMTGAPQGLPASGGNVSLDDFHGISRMAGYDPTTIFGVPLGKIVSQVPSQSNNNGSALGSIAQMDPEAGAMMNMGKEMMGSNNPSNDQSGSSDSGIGGL